MIELATHQRECAEAPRWVSQREAARILGIGLGTFARIQGHIPVARREIAGTRVKYDRADLERLAAESIKVPAGGAA